MSTEANFRPKSIVVARERATSSFSWQVLGDGAWLRSFDTLFFAKRYAKRIRRNGAPVEGQVVFRA